MTAIAIVGMACRYPDARTPGELWENVLAQRRAFRRIPEERMRLEDYWSPARGAPDRTYSTEAALVYYKDAVRLFPRNRPLTISYAEALVAAGQADAAHDVLLDLLNNVEATPEQLRLIARAANAEGDVGNAYFYMSYYYASIGNLPLAISQVRLALETPGVNGVDRSRFRAWLDQLISYLPDDHRERALADPP